MKQSIIRFFALVVVVMSITSCQKEEDISDARFFATMEDCTDLYSKTVLNDNSLFWTTGDQIKIFGNNSEDNEGHLYSATPTQGGLQAGFYSVGTEVLESSTYHAVYPADIAEDSNVITLPAVQNSADGNLRGLPMYAISESNGLSFKCLCGVLKFTLIKNSTSVSRIDIIADRVINGTFDVTYNHGDPQLTYRNDESGSCTTTLECTAQSIASGHDFFIYLPAGNYDTLKFKIYDNEGNASVLTAKEGSSITVERSKYTTITLGSENIILKPVGAKGGLFTVNSNGDQVWFSQGALWLKPIINRYWMEDGEWSRWEEEITGWEWVFRDEQYQVPEGDVYVWGASGYNNTIEFYGPQPSLHAPMGVSDIAGTNYDWGVFNPIVNGGNQAGLWRTPTEAEWRYILLTRPNANQKRGLATVYNQRGVIILPDDFELPSGLTFTPASNIENTYPPYQYMYTDSYSWSDNQYTLHQWRQLEAAGAIFIPGRQQEIDDWDNPSIHYTVCYPDYFSTTGQVLLYDNYLYFGESGPYGTIRLIQDAE